MLYGCSGIPRALIIIDSGSEVESVAIHLRGRDYVITGFLRVCLRTVECLAEQSSLQSDAEVAVCQPFAIDILRRDILVGEQTEFVIHEAQSHSVSHTECVEWHIGRDVCCLGIMLEAHHVHGVCQVEIELRVLSCRRRIKRRRHGIVMRECHVILCTDFLRNQRHQEWQYYHYTITVHVNITQKARKYYFLCLDTC